MFDLLIPLCVVAGFILGIISGLFPGIHTNNFALLLLALAPSALDVGFSPLHIAVIILANSITHTFLDIIPSIYLGAPDADTALTVLPGHRMLMEGRGPEAVRLSALGSAGSIAVSAIIVLPMTLFFGYMYPFIQKNMALVLLFVIVLMVATEKGEQIIGQGRYTHHKYKLYALTVLLVSGALGYYAFKLESLMNPGFDSSTILLALLSGLFGASTLLISLFSDSSIPPQVVGEYSLSGRRIVRGVVTGSVAGSMVAWLPGISSSIAATLVSIFGNFGNLDNFDAGIASNEEKQVSEKSDTSICSGESTEGAAWCDSEDVDDESEPDSHDEQNSMEYIVSISSVNTANATFALAALYVIGRPRSGAMAAIDGLLGGIPDMRVLLLFFGVLAATSLMAYFTTIHIGNTIHKPLRRLDYKTMAMAVISFLAIMVFAFNGIFGIAIFMLSVALGMLPHFLGVRKMHCMGVLLIPVILYFI